MTWTRICDVDDVPEGQMRAFTVSDVQMIVLRGQDRHLVIPPSCPHMANALVEGFFDGCVLTCNKHLWQWSIADGQPMGEAETALLMYETQIRDGELRVNLTRELSYEHDEG